MFLCLLLVSTLLLASVGSLLGNYLIISHSKTACSYFISEVLNVLSFYARVHT